MMVKLSQKKEGEAAEPIAADDATATTPTATEEVKKETEEEQVKERSFDEFIAGQKVVAASVARKASEGVDNKEIKRWETYTAYKKADDEAGPKKEATPSQAVPPAAIQAKKTKTEKPIIEFVMAVPEDRGREDRRDNRENNNAGRRDNNNSKGRGKDFRSRGPNNSGGSRKSGPPAPAMDDSNFPSLNV